MRLAGSEARKTAPGRRSHRGCLPAGRPGPPTLPRIAILHGGRRHLDCVARSCCPWRAGLSRARGSGRSARAPGTEAADPDQAASGRRRAAAGSVRSMRRNGRRVRARSGTPSCQQGIVVVGPAGQSIAAAGEETAAGRGDHPVTTACCPALELLVGSLTARSHPERPGRSVPLTVSRITDGNPRPKATLSTRPTRARPAGARPTVNCGRAHRPPPALRASARGTVRRSAAWRSRPATAPASATCEPSPSS